MEAKSGVAPQSKSPALSLLFIALIGRNPQYSENILHFRSSNKHILRKYFTVLLLQCVNILDVLCSKSANAWNGLVAKVLANKYENIICYTSLPFNSGKNTTPWGLKHSKTAIHSSHMQNIKFSIELVKDEWPTQTSAVYSTTNRWSTQRANERYKDHLGGQLTRQILPTKPNFQSHHRFM